MTNVHVAIKPQYLKVTRDDNGLLRGEGNNFVITDVHDEDLKPFILPFLTFNGEVSIHVQQGPPNVYKAGKIHSAYKKVIEADAKMEEEIVQLIRVYVQPYIYEGVTYIGFENWYENLLYLIEHRVEFGDLTCLESVRGSNLLFCGAGPSINRYKEQITKAISHHHYLVAAGGSGIRVMQKWGVQPHFCVAFDCWDTQWSNVFEHLDPEWIKGQTLVCNLCLDPQSLRKWVECGGNLIVMGGIGASEYFAYLSGLPNIVEGLTVSVFAATFANSVGASLTYAGLDLAFDQAGKMYEDNDEILLHPTDSIQYVGDIKTKATWLNEAAALTQTLKGFGMVASRLGYGGMEVDGIRRTSYPNNPSMGIANMKFKFRPINLDRYRTLLKGRIESLLSTWDSEDGIANTLLMRQYQVRSQATVIRGGVPHDLLIREVSEYHMDELYYLHGVLKELDD